MIYIDFDNLEANRKEDYWEWRDKIIILCVKLLHESDSAKNSEQEKRKAYANYERLIIYYSQTSHPWILPNKENYKQFIEFIC